MAVDHRLGMLRQALDRASGVPGGRKVVMAARVTPALGVGIRDFKRWMMVPKLLAAKILPIWIEIKRQKRLR